MKHDCYFWYSKDFTSFYIAPLRLDMNLPIFNEKISGAELLVPNDTDKLPVIYPYGPDRIENTPYNRLIGHSYRHFLRTCYKDLYEYRINLTNGMVLSNIGDGVYIKNTTKAFINLCIFKLMGTSINIADWQAERFYQVQDAVVQPTEHVTSEPVNYICGLFIPEIF